VNLYSYLESALIAVIGIISIYYAAKLLMPRLVHGVRVSIAQRLDRSPEGSWRHKTAARVRGAASSGGCGSGCSSGCSNCGLATQVHPPLAGDDNASR